MKELMKSFLKVGLPRLLFWGWNGLFVCVAVFGIGPELLPELWRDIERARVPWTLAVALGCALLIPPVVIAAVVWRFRQPPQRLLSLLYGVEAPLFLLCLWRLLLLRELNPGVVLLTLGFALAALMCAVDLFFPAPASTEIGVVAKSAGATVALLAGAYVALFLAFYVVPCGVLTVREILRFEWLEMVVSPPSRFHDWIEGLAILLAFFTLLLFLAIPLALPWIYGRLWWRSMRSRLAWVTSVVSIALAVVLFVVANHQPQRSVFERLAKPPATDAEKRGLLEDSERIRRGLLNAYLGSYRYLGCVSDDTKLPWLYKKAFGGEAKDYRWVDRWHGRVVRPVLYDGDSLRADQTRAEQLYAQFFDVPIQKAERRAIVHALEASWDRAEVSAGLLDVEGKKVRMVSQDVTLHEEAGWAELEVYEVYENQTHEDQEIFYYLALPETAAVTGLWLGDSPDRSRRFEPTIAPRGAAQAVYKAEVQRRIDPALVEQVGPRQVRLRAFPVPMRSWEEDQPIPRLHLWLTVRIPEVGGGWQLPRLVERRNVFWDEASGRSWNGRPASEESWLPSSWPVAASQMPSSGFAANVAGYRVTAAPMSSVPSVPIGKSIAVVIDTSRSMAAHTREIETALARLEASGARLSGLYGVGSEGNPRTLAGRAAAARLVFWGSQRSDGLLGRVAPLPLEDADAVLILTDEGGYDLPATDGEPAVLPTPTWLVHLGGSWPAAYDDGVLAALQASGGGVVGSVDEAVAALARRRSGPVRELAADGYLWRFEPAAQPAETPVPSGFERVAARQLIEVLGQEGSLERLDAVHALARNYGVVSSWSSMLVLVEDRQREALEKAEAEQDRFERESESGTEQLSPPASPFAVSGVPEPETWLLLVLAAAGLGVLAARNR